MTCVFAPHALNETPSEISLDDIRPGDVVLSRSMRQGRTVELGHVAIYVGGGTVIVAPRTGAAVRLRPLLPSAVHAVRRVLA